MSQAGLIWRADPCFGAHPIVPRSASLTPLVPRGQEPLPIKGRPPPTSGLPLTIKVALTPERTAGPEDSSTSGVRSGGDERALPS